MFPSVRNASFIIPWPIRLVCKKPLFTLAGEYQPDNMTDMHIVLQLARHLIRSTPYS